MLHRFLKNSRRSSNDLVQSAVEEKQRNLAEKRKDLQRELNSNKRLHAEHSSNLGASSGTRFAIQKAKIDAKLDNLPLYGGMPTKIMVLLIAVVLLWSGWIFTMLFN